MSSAYALPPRSAPALSLKSRIQSHASTSKATIESSLQALPACRILLDFLPRPPTLREIITAYSSKGQGGRDVLIALLNAKATEESRIAAIATLQRHILQMQLAAAQIRQEQQCHPPKSPVSPTSALSSSGLREVSPSVRARKEARARPYTRPQKSESFDWAVPRRRWDAVSDERRTGEE